MFDTTAETKEDLAIGRLDVSVSMSNQKLQSRRMLREACYDSLKGVHLLKSFSKAPAHLSGNSILPLVY